MMTLCRRYVAVCARLPESLPALLARVAIAQVFWFSAQTKISGGSFLGQNWQFWNLTDSTYMLFEYEYALPLLPVKLAAMLATFGEFFLSLALFLGLFTRLGALGLLIMTGVIQVFVYPDAWKVHILWAALLVYLIRYGAGVFSLDAILRRYLRD